MNPADAPAFRFLNAIATDLARGEITFPTFNQATLKIRQTLDVPDVDAERVANVVATEPLLAARLVRMANAAAMNPSGKPVADVRSAIVRLGFSVVRSVAVAVAFEQLRERVVAPEHGRLAAAAWHHSLHVAATAYVLAKRMTRLNPDEALFAGLVHDIGHFYLLSQASKYPELERAPAELDALLADWHPSIGQSVLHDFRLAEGILEAVAEHEHATYRLPLRTLHDLVTLANLCCADTNPCARYRVVPPGTLGEPEVIATLASARDETAALVAALSA